MIEKIAKIESTTLGYEDHGIPSFMLNMSFGTNNQGFGNRDLRSWGTDILFAIMDACGVRSWEEVKGRTVLALYDEGGYFPIGIKPLPTERGTGFIIVDDKRIEKV